MATTRPRISGVVLICTRLFADTVNGLRRGSDGNQHDSKEPIVGHQGGDGAADAERGGAGDEDRNRRPGALRRHEGTDHRAERHHRVSTPYSPAPAWKTVTDIVDMKIGKLSPKVPMMNSISSTTWRSRRVPT